MTPGKRKATRSPDSHATFPDEPGISRFVACPACGKSFVAAFVGDHAWKCGAIKNNSRLLQDQEGRLPNESNCSRKKTAKDKFVECPTCTKSFPRHAIESHAWRCLPPKQRCQGDATQPVRQHLSTIVVATAEQVVANTRSIRPDEEHTQLRARDKRVGPSAVLSAGADDGKVVTNTAPSKTAACVVAEGPYDDELDRQSRRQSRPGERGDALQARE